MAGQGVAFGEVPGPGVSLQELTLEELRKYRAHLVHEEDRVSYWRRLVHARIDVLEAQRVHHGLLDLAQVTRALGDTAGGASRRALVSVDAHQPLPELPVLEDVWLNPADPMSDDDVTEAVARLRAAEVQLTSYRRALHQRIDSATDELVERYRQDPTAAVAVLRSRRNHRRDATGAD